MLQADHQPDGRQYVPLRNECVCFWYATATGGFERLVHFTLAVVTLCGVIVSLLSLGHSLRLRNARCNLSLQTNATRLETVEEPRADNLATTGKACRGFNTPDAGVSPWFQQ
ncbi:hypothetical protein PC116_g10265 [Phytophthora cactorum]|uniref:Uncharacterized protein n=1 Tax=Phytophthora cactorum TaxID=29920 RepID=A0A8T1KYD3_9STRA|nr:hypothetical protein PC117_g3727 [Phytophthora cactorum]KAG3023316.1 hypothetical protein PC120_g7640 [Phytophthora cactorum]KAG3187737.1 hypothetical protein C6341_g3114 [Phytophthora cactorum]KAG4241823.1 hypothetical protein PC116_g10265 [Phytophthora cactorum]